jgi:hypothetical protein
MSILGWWRKRMAGRRTSDTSRALDESGITARVDLLRLEAFAEAAYDANRVRNMREAGSRKRATILTGRSRPHSARGCTTKRRG